MKFLSISWYKIPVGIRRFLGVLLLFILAYWTFTFSVKLICYLLYAGTNLIDKFFGFLVGWGGRMKKHLVIKYFDTYPENKFYFDSKEKAEKFLKEKRKVDTGYLTTYEYRGEVEINHKFREVRNETFK